MRGKQPKPRGRFQYRAWRTDNDNVTFPRAGGDFDGNVSRTADAVCGVGAVADMIRAALRGEETTDA